MGLWFIEKSGFAFGCLSRDDTLTGSASAFRLNTFPDCDSSILRLQRQVAKECSDPRIIDGSAIGAKLIKPFVVRKELLHPLLIGIKKCFARNSIESEI